MARNPNASYESNNHQRMPVIPFGTSFCKTIFTPFTTTSTQINLNSYITPYSVGFICIGYIFTGSVNAENHNIAFSYSRNTAQNSMIRINAMSTDSFFNVSMSGNPATILNVTIGSASVNGNLLIGIWGMAKE